jgi:hypothetical protein
MKKTGSRTATWLALCLFTSFPVAAVDIEQALWEERLLVLVAPVATDPRAAEQRERLQARSDAVADRRLRIYELYADQGWIDGQALSAGQLQALRRKFALALDSRELILIGLDGGIKRRDRLDTPLHDVFMQIDGMPMRRQEIESRLDAGLPVTRP